MTPHRRGLDVDEDLEFQKKEWRAQRAGLALLFLIVLAAAAGFTGMGGPLSRGEAGRPGDPVFARFERFVRRGSTSTITLRLRSKPGEVRFWVSDQYFERVRIAGVVPEPRAIAIEAGRHLYTIQNGSSDVAIALHLEHIRVGRIEAAIGLVDGPAVRFTQWALF